MRIKIHFENLVQFLNLTLLSPSFVNSYVNSLFYTFFLTGKFSSLSLLTMDKK